ncbi:MAG: sel1 repeat family protein [Magnetococcales bacterium]|nr:sel1 repeat family protein [Magnetococcales bacterium]
MRKTGLLVYRTLYGAIGAMIAMNAITSIVHAEETPLEADYKAGSLAYQGDDWFSAIPPLRRAATAGHLPSMEMLAMILNRAAETTESMEWYHKAAEAGSLEGAYWLGVLLQVEIDAARAAPKTAKPEAAPKSSIPHGPEEALKWLSLAAEKNHPAAMFAMSNVHTMGKLGQPVDYKIALDWLQRSADAGYTPAMKELSKVHAQGLLGLSPNAKEALRWDKAVKEIEQAAINAAKQQAKSNPGTDKKK